MAHEQPQQLSEMAQEIISLIVYELRHNTDVLRALCLVSRCFLHDSRRLLYRNLALSDSGLSVPPGYPMYRMEKGIRLFTTLVTTTPSLAKHVHTLIMDLREEGPNPGTREHIKRLIMTSLLFMTNLKILSITGSLSVAGIDLLFNRCTFQLETFHYWSSLDPRPYVSDITAFLSMQPKIKDLAIHWCSQTPFPYAFCSQLEQLTGDISTIESIFPFLPITRLVLVSIMENTLTLSPSIVDRLSNLHTLCIRALECRRVMEPLIPHLKRLQVFHMSEISIFSQRFVGYNPPLIPKLYNLRVFIYSARRIDNTRWDNPVQLVEERIKEWGPLVNEWFRELRYLQVAYFQVGNSPTNQKQFLAWKYDAVEPVEIEGTEVWNISPWA